MAFRFMSNALPAIALALPLITSPASQGQLKAPTANPRVRSNSALPIRTQQNIST